ncbi:MAG: hypothetical protein R2722_15505 [Tessaracoccus sp.]
MAEVRIFDPVSGEGLQQLVREALGEPVRPTEPGHTASPVSDDETVPEVGVADLPSGEGVPFSW